MTANARVGLVSATSGPPVVPANVRVGQIVAVIGTGTAANVRVGLVTTTVFTPAKVRVGKLAGSIIRTSGGLPAARTVARLWDREPERVYKSSAWTAGSEFIWYAGLDGAPGAYSWQPIAVVAPPPTGFVRPSGAGFTRYEDLYVSGDTVSAAMSRLGSRAGSAGDVITFPVGRFVSNDFATGFRTAITIPTQCGGIWGSGPGTLGGTDGTVFSIAPNSSTAVAQGWVPAQSSGQPVQMRVLKSSASPYALSFGQFAVEGTEQGHIYHNFSVYQAQQAPSFTDIRTSGWSGNNGSPPGETFGLEVQSAPGHTLLRVEADGRRTPGGPVFGAVGITSSSQYGGTWTDCWAHDCAAAYVVFYKAFNQDTYNLRIGRPGDPGSTLVGGEINHEVVNNITHHNPVFDFTRTQHVHLTHSNTSFTATYNGHAVSAVNGTATFIDPTYPNIWGDGYFYIQSWQTGVDGTVNNDSMTTAPVVTLADGVTHKPYVWVHGTHQLIT